MRIAFVVPAYQAERTLSSVVTGLLAVGQTLAETTEPCVIVVDDGSTDDTAFCARSAGALTLRHETNRGKGAALSTGFRKAQELGARAVVTVDADGQHPPEEAERLARDTAAPEALVLGVRDLARDGAPRKNRFSNAFSNSWMSLFCRRKLADTQCGLRRYPVPEIAELGLEGTGYELEAEAVLKAVRKGLCVVEVPVRVIYPKGSERLTHFHSVRDPARIVCQLVKSAWNTPWTARSGAAVGGRVWLRRVIGWLASLCFGVWLFHLGLGYWCRIDPPRTEPARLEANRPKARLRTLGESFVIERPGLLEVHLSGSPEAIGWAHSRLLYPEMLENEGVLLGSFRKAVPTALLRGLLLDLAQLRYRHLADSMSTERRAELAAGALGFQPDPYSGVFPTFQRFVYLNALYDIALSFEHSPLIGCTTFTFTGRSLERGGALLARNFDFEVDPIFDQKKAVFFVREAGKIPFASVAWPGLVGVVSGMNLEGLALVVHGGRAGEPRVDGEPVVHALRAVLSNARNTQEATEQLARRAPLVSHIVVMADAAGRAVTVERVPGRPDVVIELGGAAAMTNHFSGSSASDPKNLAVRKNTSTLSRLTRAEELVGRVSRPVTPEAAVALLRDRRAVGDRELPLGDRNAIDAMIATHGVVMQTSERVLWVSAAPHLLGRFTGLDLRHRLREDFVPDPEAKLPEIAPDPLLYRPRAARQ